MEAGFPDGLVVATVEVTVKLSARDVTVQIQLIEEQGGPIELIDGVDRVTRAPELDGLDLLDHEALATRLVGWARTADTSNAVTLWCYRSRQPDLLAALDPPGAGPPYVIDPNPPKPAPGPKPDAESES